MEPLSVTSRDPEYGSDPILQSVGSSKPHGGRHLLWHFVVSFTAASFIAFLMVNCFHAINIETVFSGKGEGPLGGPSGTSRRLAGKEGPLDTTPLGLCSPMGSSGEQGGSSSSPDEAAQETEASTEGSGEEAGGGVGEGAGVKVGEGRVQRTRRGGVGGKTEGEGSSEKEEEESDESEYKYGKDEGQGQDEGGGEGADEESFKTVSSGSSYTTAESRPSGDAGGSEDGGRPSRQRGQHGDRNRSPSPPRWRSPPGGFSLPPAPSHSSGVGEAASVKSVVGGSPEASFAFPSSSPSPEGPEGSSGADASSSAAGSAPPDPSPPKSLRVPLMYTGRGDREWEEPDPAPSKGTKKGAPTLYFLLGGCGGDQKKGASTSAGAASSTKTGRGRRGSSRSHRRKHDEHKHAESAAGGADGRRGRSSSRQPPSPPYRWRSQSGSFQLSAPPTAPRRSASRISLKSQGDGDSGAVFAFPSTQSPEGPEGPSAGAAASAAAGFTSSDSSPPTSPCGPLMYRRKGGGGEKAAQQTSVAAGASTQGGSGGGAGSEGTGRSLLTPEVGERPFGSLDTPFQARVPGNASGRDRGAPGRPIGAYTPRESAGPPEKQRKGDGDDEQEDSSRLGGPYSTGGLLKKGTPYYPPVQGTRGRRDHSRAKSAGGRGAAAAAAAAGVAGGAGEGAGEGVTEEGAGGGGGSADDRDDDTAAGGGGDPGAGHSSGPGAGHRDGAGGGAAGGAGAGAPAGGGGGGADGGGSAAAAAGGGGAAAAGAAVGRGKHGAPCGRPGGSGASRIPKRAPAPSTRGPQQPAPAARGAPAADPAAAAASRQVGGPPPPAAQPGASPAPGPFGPGGFPGARSKILGRAPVFRPQWGGGGGARPKSREGGVPPSGEEGSGTEKSSSKHKKRSGIPRKKGAGTLAGAEGAGPSSGTPSRGKHAKVPPFHGPSGVAAAAKAVSESAEGGSRKEESASQPQQPEEIGPPREEGIPLVDILRMGTHGFLGLVEEAWQTASPDDPLHVWKEQVTDPTLLKVLKVKRQRDTANDLLDWWRELWDRYRRMGVVRVRVNDWSDEDVFFSDDDDDDDD